MEISRLKETSKNCFVDLTFSCSCDEIFYSNSSEIRNSDGINCPYCNNIYYFTEDDFNKLVLSLNVYSGCISEKNRTQEIELATKL